jgi:hypothetical protein
MLDILHLACAFSYWLDVYDIITRGGTYLVNNRQKIVLAFSDFANL